MTEFSAQEEIRFLRETLRRESANALQAQEQLTIVQEKGTKLLEENRKLKAELAYLTQALILPGWTCQDKECGVFNGEMKEKRALCRSCDKPQGHVVESSS